ncbi:putative ribonuclease H-like domain-containing protein [Tanacetum coccineum]
MVVQDQAEMGEGSANPTDPHHTPTFIQPSTSQPQKKQKSRKPKRKDTHIPQSSSPTEHVADEAVYKELDDSLVRAATTASSLEAEQDSGGGPRRQETMGDTIAQTRFENVSKLSNDPLLARGNTLRNGDDSLKLKELMGLCTNLQTRVLDLETTKTTQANEIDSLKRRVKRLEKKKRSRTHRLKRLYKVGLSARVESFGDKEDLDDADMFDVNTLTGDEVLAEPEVVVKDVKANVVEEPSVPVSAASTKVSVAKTTTTATIPTPMKGIVITELARRRKKLISLMEEIASKITRRVDEEERLVREKDEANVALTKEWDDIQAKVDADYQLAQRLQAEEQEQFITKQKATLFKELLEQRRKHFAAKRAEEKRNKPPTQAQQRKIMCTYLKNMEGKKPKDLKNKSFDSIQKMFDKAFKRVNTFVDFRTDLVEGSSKRAGTELEQEVTKKQKVDDVQETAEVDNDQEAAKIKELMEIVPDKEEVAIDAIPLAVKPPSIVDWKIHKEGKKTYYQIIRADGSSKMYLVFSHMLKSFDKEDLETLWKLVKAKHGSTRPEEGYERVLWGDLKLLMKKLEILKKNIKFRGGLLGLKDFLMILELLLLRSEDPNQHLKDFLKIIDSLDLNVENRERTCLPLFQFSLRDQASNWLERLPVGSISTWEDLTTRFLAQFFPPGRTAKLRNDILMFQQH